MAPQDLVAIFLFALAAAAIAFLWFVRSNRHPGPKTIAAPSGFDRLGSMRAVEGDSEVTLVSPGPNRIAVIKAARELTGMGLAQAKAFTETPNASFGRLTADAAEIFKQKLEAAGAIVSVRAGAGDTAPPAGGALVNLVLADPGPRKIAVIRALRMATGASLTQAKNVVDTPQFTIEGIDAGLARNLQEKLEAAGASVQITPFS